MIYLQDFRFYSWPNIKNTLTNPAKIVCEIVSTIFLCYQELSLI